MKLSFLAIICGSAMIGISIPDIVNYLKMGTLPPSNIMLVTGVGLVIAVVGTIFAQKS